MSSRGGGFLLSPSASSINSSSAASASTLPQPRNAPLKSGGTKESAFIRHVDTRILHIQRRFAKRTTFTTDIADDGTRSQQPAHDPWPGDVKGYITMKEACKDLSEIVDVVWVSGTPSLQIPYLINLALLLTTVVGGMPPTPKSLFKLLGKLDRAFASLLQGRDVETGEILPGFEARRGVSGTEKVRIRSLVERTRFSVIEAFRRGEFEEEEDEMDDSGVDVDMDGELVLENGDDDEEVEESWDMQLARVYDLTVVELGDSLEEPSLGIITEGRAWGAVREANAQTL